MPNLMDNLWNRLRIVTGACAASSTLDDVKDMLEKGEQYSRHAVASGIFTQANGDSIAKLRAAADALGKVHEGLSLLQEVCLDVQAIARIRGAIKILSNPQSLQPGSQEGARAFGELFVGTGRFVSKLPPPVNAYGQLLESSGNFFLDIQRLLDPERRPNGAGLREVMEELDRQARGF